ncbi:MAG: methyltransferase [Bacteroidales bacterium]
MKAPSQIITSTKMRLTAIYILLLPILILVLSGDIRWAEGWMVSGWVTVLCFRTLLYLYRNNPQILANCFKKPILNAQSNRDKYVEYGLIFGFILWIIIMPIDVKQFGWSCLPYWVKTLGAIGLCYSFYLIFNACKENSVLSSLVRNQHERRHQVVANGVYSIVRHPIYLGGVLFFVGSPMLMGSAFGFGIGILLSLLLVERIISEERLLNEEHTNSIKYRLIPFVW